MNFEWSESQREVQTLSRTILKAELCEADLREIDADGSFFHAPLWRKLAEAGLLGAGFPEAYGGHGGGIGELCALLIEIGRNVAPVPALACLALGATALSHAGTDEQKARWLARVVSGEVLLSAAYEEASLGDPLAPTMRASRVGGALRVDGTKICVPYADRALRILAPLTLDGELALVWIDPNGPGVALERGTATHGEPQFRLDLQGATISGEELLVHGARARQAMRFLLPAAGAAICAVALGVCERALEITAKYVTERHQFGVPIGSFQAVRQRAADAYIDIEAIRLSLQQLLFLLEQGRDAELACCVAKYHACEAGYRVTYAAQHLHGGIGYDVDYPLHRYYLWSKALELTLGSAPRHAQWIGRMLAERPVRIGDS
jgi:alkylation response protein AidB-like acyl-CoA dehydrogenase